MATGEQPEVQKDKAKKPLTLAENSQTHENLTTLREQITDPERAFEVLEKKLLAIDKPLSPEDANTAAFEVLEYWQEIYFGFESETQYGNTRRDTGALKEYLAIFLFSGSQLLEQKDAEERLRQKVHFHGGLKSIVSSLKLASQNVKLGAPTDRVGKEIHNWRNPTWMSEETQPLAEFIAMRSLQDYLKSDKAQQDQWQLLENLIGLKSELRLPSLVYYEGQQPMYGIPIIDSIDKTTGTLLNRMLDPTNKNLQEDQKHFSSIIIGQKEYSHNDEFGNQVSKFFNGSKRTNDDANKTRNTFLHLPLPENKGDKDKWLVSLLFFDPDGNTLTKTFLDEQANKPIERIDIHDFDPQPTAALNVHLHALGRARQFTQDNLPMLRKTRRYAEYDNEDPHQLDPTQQVIRYSFNGPEVRRYTFMPREKRDILDFYQTELDPKTCEQKLSENSKTKDWLTKIQQEAKAFFTGVAHGKLEKFVDQSLAQRIGTNPDFYEKNADLFVLELILAATGRTIMEEPLKLPDRYPSFASLLQKNDSRFASLHDEWLRTEVRRKFEQTPEFAAYQKQKEKFLAEAKTAIYQAQLQYDKQTHGKENDYLDNMEQFVKEYLGKFLDDLPYSFGTDVETARLIARRVIEKRQFPQLTVRNIAGWAAGFGGHERIELDTEINGYVSFVNVYIHELFHSILQRDHDQFGYNLNEGITESRAMQFSKNNKMEAGGTYPRVVAFVRQFEEIIGSDALCRFYTQKDIPAVDFHDLPKIGAEGREYTFLEGVNLSSPARRFLCRKILDRIDLDAIKNGTYVEKRDALKTINTFLKSFFNTSFSPENYPKSNMGNHYGDLAKDLTSLIQRYGN